MSSKRLHVVYVCREFAPYTGGGIGTYISQVAKAMANAGHKVTVLTDLLDRKPVSELDIGQIEFMEPVRFDSSRLQDFMSAHQAYSYRVYETLQKLSAQSDIDVIEFPEFRGEGFATIRAKRTLNEFASTKLVVKCHTPSSLIEHINDEYFLQPRHDLDIFMEDYSVHYADGVTSPSKSLADYFNYRLGRSDIRNCPYPLVLPESNSKREFTRDSLKEIAYIGSIQPRKGVDHFVDAALMVLEEDASFTFSIYGGERNESVLWSSYTDILKARIPEHLAKHFNFAGAVAAESVPDLLQKTSVVMLPSRWENWANACLEAMNMGCIVCASRSGGMGEMIEPQKSGFWINPQDVRSTVRLIRKLPKLGKKAEKISIAAKKRASELTNPARTVAKIESNYASIPAKKSWIRIGELDELPLVSVIIPFFNLKDTLDETVESVKASTYPNLEIIVVNDGSTDALAVERFNGLEGVVKLDKPNSGLSDTRNFGISRSNGEFFLPLDSDDTIEPSYIERAVECLLNLPDLSYVGCHAKNFGAFEGEYTPLGFVKPLMGIQNTDTKCSALFRKAAIDATYDPQLYSYEDWDFLISVHEEGGGGEILPKALFNYRRHYGSMVFSTANHQKSHLLQYMMHKHADFWEEDYPRLSRILLRLWKDEEFERNFRNVELVQIYYGVEGVYSEKHSSILTVYRGQKQNLRFRLPTAGMITSIRIDPCASPSLIRVHHIQIRELGDFGISHEFKDKTSLSKLSIEGTAKGGWDEDSLLIHSDGDDPQLHINGLSIDPSRPTEIWIELTVDASG
jgi:glycosyltransferase involved in cell wall biosynthesis